MYRIQQSKSISLLLLVLTLLVTPSTAQTKQETQDWIVEKLNYTASEQIFWNKNLKDDHWRWYWYREASDFSVRGDSLFFKVKNKFSNEHLLQGAEKIRDDYYCKCSICTKYRSNQSTVTYVSIPLQDFEIIDRNYYDLTYDWSSWGLGDLRPGVFQFIIVCNTQSISVKGDITGTSRAERVFYLSDYPVKQRRFYISLNPEKETGILERLTKAFTHLKSFYPNKKEIF